MDADASGALWMSAGQDWEPGRQRRDGVRTRQSLLAAAGLRFAQRGYSRVTLKEIAEDVGVTPALVVHHFGSKRALFEEVAKSDTGFTLPSLGRCHSEAQLKAYARAVIANLEDRSARAPAIALLRSLDLDDGDLFRVVLEKRILEVWESEIVGPHSELRMRFLTGLLMGVGLFTVGALTEPDRSPMEPAEVELAASYLAELLAVCLRPLAEQPSGASSNRMRDAAGPTLR